MSATGHHEDYARHREAAGPSDRSFGITFVVVFALIAAWPLLHGDGPRWWAVVVAAALLVVSLVVPRVLRPLNRLWMRFGLLLHRITTPVLLGIVFYLVVWPTGALMRLFGKRPLRLEVDRSAESYWTERDARIDSHSSMRNQF